MENELNQKLIRVESSINNFQLLYTRAPTLNQQHENINTSNNSAESERENNANFNFDYKGVESDLSITIVWFACEETYIGRRFDVLLVINFIYFSVPICTRFNKTRGVARNWKACPRWISYMERVCFPQL